MLKLFIIFLIISILHSTIVEGAKKGKKKKSSNKKKNLKNKNKGVPEELQGFNIPRKYLKERQHDGYCKMCLHIVSEGKKFLTRVKDYPPLKVGRRMNVAGKSISKEIPYHTSETVVLHAFADICTRSHWNGHMEQKEMLNMPGGDMGMAANTKYRWMVGEKVHPEKRPGEELKLGDMEGFLKGLCNKFVEDHEDKLIKLFMEDNEKQINRYCRKSLKMPECPLLDKISHDDLYGSYTMEEQKAEL